MPIPRAAASLASLLPLLLVLPAAAEPEEEPDYARDGWYVGVYTAKGFENFSPNRRNDGDDAGAWGFNARFGWRDLRYLAIEFQYEWIDDFEINGPTQKTDIRFNTFTLNAKGYLPVGRFAPFLLAGAGFAQADASGTPSDRDGDFVSRWGGGIDFYLTENLVFAADTTYVLPRGDLDNLDYFTVSWGLQWRFDPFVY